MTDMLTQWAAALRVELRHRKRIHMEAIGPLPLDMVEQLLERAGLAGDVATSGYVEPLSTAIEFEAANVRRNRAEEEWAETWRGFDRTPRTSVVREPNRG